MVKQIAPLAGCPLWGRSWPGCIGVASGSNASCGPMPRRPDCSSGGQSEDREPRRDRVLGGGATALGLPGPGRLARGAGEGGAAPVVLPPLLRGVGVRQGAARVPGVPERRGTPPARQGTAGAVRDRPLGRRSRRTVQRANAAIATDGGERVTRRHYGDHELAEVPPGVVQWALGGGRLHSLAAERTRWSTVLLQRGTSGVDSGLGEAGPAGGLDRGQHRPDVVVGAVIDRGEAVDEPVVEHRPRGRVVAQTDQQVPDLGP